MENAPQWGRLLNPSDVSHLRVMFDEYFVQVLPNRSGSREDELDRRRMIDYGDLFAGLLRQALLVAPYPQLLRDMLAICDGQSKKLLKLSAMLLNKSRGETSEHAVAFGREYDAFAKGGSTAGIHYASERANRFVKSAKDAGQESALTAKHDRPRQPYPGKSRWRPQQQRRFLSKAKEPTKPP